MSKLLFRVIEWHNNDCSALKLDADVILERDNWNDYNYFTLYGLHLGYKITSTNKTEYIGSIKILKKGQCTGEKNLVPISFHTLSDDFCSYISSLDTYEQINRLLSPEIRKELIDALNVYIFSEAIREKFKNEDGVTNSFFRWGGMDESSIAIARSFIFDDFVIPKSNLQEIKVTLNDSGEVLTFRFKPNDEIDIYNDIPYSASVLIGRNGCGKSTILYRLSRLLMASAEQRGKYQKHLLGKIEPEGIGFRKVICLSYSAFDNFQMPGFKYSERLMLKQGLESGEGRFIFCGIRDVVKELTNELENISKEEEEYANKLMTDTCTDTNLKTISQLADEFAANLEHIHKTNKNSIQSYLDILSEEFSFRHLIEELKEADKWFMFDKEICRKVFLNQSTGNKFVLHSLSCIIRHIGEKSLILFDEPENHLHPPLLAYLMKAIRGLLKSNQSIMIVATHSPVVIQETLSCNVNIVQRHGNRLTFRVPSIQTYGENIGMITSEVFNLTSYETDFHRVLDSLYEQLPKNDVNLFVNTFKQCMGGQVSNQALAYILSKFYSEDVET